MKKAKIMLTALAVVAVVGAGLAFKAKTFTTAYCTSTAPGVCGTITKTLKVGGLNTVYFTPYRVNVPCTQLQCTISAILTTE